MGALGSDVEGGGRECAGGCAGEGGGRECAEEGGRDRRGEEGEGGYPWQESLQLQASSSTCLALVLLVSKLRQMSKRQI